VLKINLLPEEVKGDKRVSLNFSMFFKLAAVALSVCILFTIVLHILIMDAEKDLESTAFYSKSAEKVIKEFKNMDKERKNLQNQINDLKSVEPSFLWGNFLEQLKYCIPEDVWLTSLEGKSSEKVILLIGESPSYSSIRSVLPSLQSIDLVKNAELKEVKMIEGTDFYEFRIVCSLGVNKDDGVNRKD